MWVLVLFLDDLSEPLLMERQQAPPGGSISLGGSRQQRLGMG